MGWTVRGLLLVAMMMAASGCTAVAQGNLSKQARADVLYPPLQSAKPAATAPSGASTVRVYWYFAGR